MTYWRGNEGQVRAAVALADAHVTQRPEYRAGRLLPKKDWITKRWAFPEESATANVWFIPAYVRITKPGGVTEVPAIDKKAVQDLAAEAGTPREIGKVI